MYRIDRKQRNSSQALCVDQGANHMSHQRAHNTWYQDAFWCIRMENGLQLNEAAPACSSSSPDVLRSGGCKDNHPSRCNNYWFLVAREPYNWVTRVDGRSNRNGGTFYRVVPPLQWAGAMAVGEFLWRAFQWLVYGGLTPPLQSCFFVIWLVFIPSFRIGLPTASTLYLFFLESTVTI